MMGVSSGCGLCPWSCSGKVGAYAGSVDVMQIRVVDRDAEVSRSCFQTLPYFNSIPNPNPAPSRDQF